MSYQKLTIPIRGMHCRSCEILLEDNIGSVSGVEKVKTSFKKGSADIAYDPGLFQIRDVERAIKDAGYAVGKEERKTFLSRNVADYVELAVVGSLVFLAYVLLDRFGLFTMNISTTGVSSLVGVLLVGLTAGVSTCMALIGGLVLSLSSRHAELHPEASTSQKFRPHIFFNLGRIIAYILFGGVIGLVGSTLQLSFTVIGFITIVLGGIMLLMGLKLINIFPRLENVSVSLPSSISKFLGLKGEVKEYSHRGSFMLGALTFFVPCGFTQAMQLYAMSTGSFVQGALIMGLFALGTLPGIIGIGGITSAIKGTIARYFFKFAGVVVIFLAFFNISNGYNLTGISLSSFIPEVTITDKANTPTAVVEDGKQIIEMEQAGNGYNPKNFTVKKGIPVVWKINSINPYSCAAYIRMPAYNIAQPLNPGENIITFTPTETGKIKFTCSMGMFAGSFTIID